MQTTKAMLKTKISISILLCGILFIWGFQVSAEEWTQEQKEIWNSAKASWEYFKQGDLEGFMSIYHDDAVEWWRNQFTPLGKAEMKGYFHSWLNSDKPISYEFEPHSIQIFGNVANVFYSVKWKASFLSGYDRHMQTWIKQDNKWKFIGGMSASCDKPLFCN